MKIQFIGATHEVTGSCTLLEVGGRFYLVDCGMEQGTDVFQNIPLPVLPSQIEARRKSGLVAKIKNKTGQENPNRFRGGVRGI